MKMLVPFLPVALALSAAPAMPQSPYEIVDASAAADWRPIAPENLLVMTLGDGREIFIELAPDFAPVHVGNIRGMARAHWYDGAAVIRVQDNYVVQWGRVEGDLPEDPATAEPTYAPLPDGVDAEPPAEFEFPFDDARWTRFMPVEAGLYAPQSGYLDGWPIGIYAAGDEAVEEIGALAHCYGMVGVGRGDNPDPGTGAELYVVIGHAPRHLDRNIAVVGRIVEGIEHLSSLPRGTGPLGFYESEEEHVPIASVRLASELPEGHRPRFEVMRTDSGAFASYVNARANRSGWFVRAAGAVDVCNVNLPIRRVAGD